MMNIYMNLLICHPVEILYRLLTQLDFPAMSFSLFFMGFAKEEDIPKDQAERTRWAFMQPGCIELT